MYAASINEGVKSYYTLQLDGHLTLKSVPVQKSRFTSGGTSWSRWQVDGKEIGIHTADDAWDLIAISAFPKEDFIRAHFRAVDGFLWIQYECVLDGKKTTVERPVNGLVIGDDPIVMFGFTDAKGNVIPNPNFSSGWNWIWILLIVLAIVIIIIILIVTLVPKSYKETYVEEKPASKANKKKKGKTTINRRSASVTTVDI